MQHRFNKLATSSPAEFDYLIIGRGSAFAYRLGEDRGVSVALIEYGGSDSGPFIQMLAALSHPMNMPLYDWAYRAVPGPALNSRSLAFPRGKVIGSSSSINEICARSCRRIMTIGRHKWRAAGHMPISYPISRKWKSPLMAQQEWALAYYPQPAIQPATTRLFARGQTEYTITVSQNNKTIGRIDKSAHLAFLACFTANHP